MIIGCRAFFYAQVQATLQFWRHNFDAPWFTSVFNSNANFPHTINDVGNNGWGTVLPLHPAPDKFPGQVDHTAWYYNPRYDSATGTWFLIKFDDAITDAQPAQPITQGSDYAALFELVAIAAHHVSPYNPPIKIPPIKSRLFGDNILPGLDTHGVQISIDKTGPRAPGYENAPGTGQYGWIAPQYEDLSFGPRKMIEFSLQRISFDLHG